MIKYKKITRFSSIKEEAKFWDNHDVSDYLPEMKETKVKLLLAKPKKEIITLRIQSDLKKRLERVAESYGINLSTLTRIWFVDKLKETKSQSLVA
jgi:predicted DNA binding CopG/RHH family protein